MTLSQKIVAEVENHPVGSASSGLVMAEVDGARIKLSLSACGHVGFTCRSLEFCQVEPLNLSTEELRSWGNRIAARVTYLMEPLVVLEVDAEAGKADLKSQAPTPRGEFRSYYEGTLYRAGGLLLRRITFDETSRQRRPVDCQMTIEVLERLTDDLVASLP
jgi:hypothetical protein